MSGPDGGVSASEDLCRFAPQPRWLGCCCIAFSLTKCAVANRHGAKWSSQGPSPCCAVPDGDLQGVLSELLRSLVHYKSNAALAGDSLHHGMDHQHMDMDLARACHSPPLLRPSSGQRLRSGGSAQGNSNILRSNSNNYSRLGSSSFKGHEDL